MRILNLTILLLVSGCGTYETVQHVGMQGPAGSRGKDGSSSHIVLTRFTSDTEVCASGAGVIIKIMEPSFLGGSYVVSQAIVCDGLNGLDGPIGPQGTAGEDGEDGADAPASPYQVTQVIDPCGDAPGIYDEVILKMSNGNLVASFSDNANGNNTRLSLLVPGNYATTDGSSCSFSVDGSGLVTW